MKMILAVRDGYHTAVRIPSFLHSDFPLDSEGFQSKAGVG